MDSEISSILNELEKEQCYLLEKTGCNIWGIKCSFVNKTILFYNRLIPYVDNNKNNDEFFELLRKSYMYYINSNIARLTYKIEEEQNGVQYFESLMKYLMKISVRLSPFKMSYLSYISKCATEYSIKLNTYNNFKSAHEKELVEFKSEVSNFTRMNDMGSVEGYFRSKFMGNELLLLNQQNTDLTEMEFKKFFFHYKAFDFIFHYNNYNLNKLNSISYAAINDELVKLYNSYGINLKSTDKQFEKYDILEKNKHMELIYSKDGSYLTDNRVQGCCLNIAIDYDLISIIDELIKGGSISKISFKITSISKNQVSLEDFDRGGPLELDVKRIPEISSFYNENYNNKLIVQHNDVKNEITFEELRDDFDMIEDSVVTQVVHLKYALLNNEYFINHLDHELIVYSLEEYDEKINNIKAKGSKDKIKSFKIDDSKIPFFYKNNRGYFLYQILDAYFINKDLLKEYFCKITHEY